MKKCPRSEGDVEKKPPMDPPPKLQRALGKEKKITKTKMSLLKKDAHALRLMDSIFSCPGDENSFRRGKDSSDSIIVEHYEGDTLVDFSSTGDQ